MAFAPLAEELRRAGQVDEAVTVCQAGLTHHPEYVSARATLGRSLLELGRADEALDELKAVLSAAPDNLSALKTAAEIYHRRGETAEALATYRIALTLVRQDPDLERLIAQLEQESPQPAAASPAQAVQEPAVEPTASAEDVALEAPPAPVLVTAPEPMSNSEVHAEPERPSDPGRAAIQRLERFLDMVDADRHRHNSHP